MPDTSSLRSSKLAFWKCHVGVVGPRPQQGSSPPFYSSKAPPPTHHPTPLLSLSVPISPLLCQTRPLTLRSLVLLPVAACHLHAPRPVTSSLSLSLFTSHPHSHFDKMCF